MNCFVWIYAHCCFSYSLFFIIGALGGDPELQVREVNSLTTKKQMKKFSSANFKNKSKLYHIENSKTRGQRV